MVASNQRLESLARSTQPCRCGCYRAEAVGDGTILTPLASAGIRVSAPLARAIPVGSTRNLEVLIP